MGINITDIILFIKMNTKIGKILFNSYDMLNLFQEKNNLFLIDFDKKEGYITLYGIHIYQGTLITPKTFEVFIEEGKKSFWSNEIKFENYKMVNHLIKLQEFA